MTMENNTPNSNINTIASHKSSSSETYTSGRKRSGSGSSSIFSRFPFLRTSESKAALNDSRFQQSSPVSAGAAGPTHSENDPEKPQRALAAALSQQKTRRRKGSLRKVALLGRGAAREKRELKTQLQLQSQSQTQTQTQTQAQLEPQPQTQPQGLLRPLTIDTSQIILQQPTVGSPIHTQQAAIPDIITDGPDIGLALPDDTPRPSMEGFAPRGAAAAIPANPPLVIGHDSHMTSPAISYTSTTDEEDAIPLSLPVPSLSQSTLASYSSGSESYYRGSSLRAASPASSIQRRRSSSKLKYAKSPLSLQGLATGSPSLGSIDSGHHDYSETEWWGWVVLVVTWFVFILGMGSCLNIWSWAWDVGSTPYAPPELEDDPTLPIVGYYPALLILTSIMAWVWVIVAWMGMKYFRHAKIPSD